MTTKFIDLEGAKIIAGEVKKRYIKPEEGISGTDLSASVLTSLGKADSAVQVESDPTVSAWAKTPEKPTYTASEILELTDITGLTNYYDRASIDARISAIPKFTIKVVDVLPEIGEAATIYLVRGDREEDKNLYTEYIYAEGTWEKLGTQSVDLTDYAKKADVPAAMTAAEVQALFAE